MALGSLAWDVAPFGFNSPVVLLGMRPRTCGRGARVRVPSQALGATRATTHGVAWGHACLWRHPARGTAHVRTLQRHRRTHDPALRLRAESTAEEAGRGDLRVDEKTVGGFQRTRYRGLDRTGRAGYLVGKPYRPSADARLMTPETPRTAVWPRAWAATCRPRCHLAVADFGEPAKRSHISKIVLSIVKIGPPKQTRTGDFGRGGTTICRSGPYLLVSKSTAHEYLSFPCLLSPSNEVLDFVKSGGF